MSKAAEHFSQFFAERVRRNAPRTFLVAYDQEGRRLSWTYGEFGRQVWRLARYLQHDMCLGPGERLATLHYNDWRTVMLYFAAWVSGACVVPINVDETRERKRFILENAGARAAVACPEAWSELESLRREVASLECISTVGGGCDDPNDIPGHDPDHEPVLTEGSLDDDALIVYTSGTTGQPKGVLLGIRQMIADAEGIRDWHRITPNDRLMCVLPIHHVNGTIVTLFTPFWAEASTVLNRKFGSPWFWRRLAEERVNLTSVVPTLLEFLLEADEDISRLDLSGFRGFICGAGPLLVDTALRFEKRFEKPIIHGYGLSETTCYSCFLPVDLSDEQRRFWLSHYGFPSIGVPIEPNEMAIMDEQGRPLPPGERGEICIRGRNVMKEYYKRPDANAQAFRDGWFRSGDEGFFHPDERGRPFFFITGRIKELIIRGGVNISPLEIDDVLKTHPAVQFGMAVPFDHRYYGEEIAAYVVPRPGLKPDADEILAHCRAHLPWHKQPKVVVFGTDVPYTSTGKPKRLELRRQLAEELAPYRDHQFRRPEAPG